MELLNIYFQKHSQLTIKYREKQQCDTTEIFGFLSKVINIIPKQVSHETVDVDPI